MTIYGTDIINHFDLRNEIVHIEGRFVYRFFDPSEQVNETGKSTEPQAELGIPRYVQLNWKGETQIQRIDTLRDLLVHKENLFFPSDLNSGFSILQTAEERVSQVQDEVLSDASVGSKLDYLLKAVNSTDVTEAIEKNITRQGSNKVRIPVLEETTRTPIQSTTVFDNESQPPDIYIKSSYVDSVIKSSNLSPINVNSLIHLEPLAENIAAAAKSKEQGKPRYGKRLLTTLSYALDKLYNESKGNKDVAKLLSIKSDGFKNWTLIGYSISKYRVENGVETYMYSRLVTQRAYRDPHVAYGKTYKYELRPIYVKRAGNIGGRIVVMGSDESSNITIHCEELRAPSPPKNLKFEYVLNNNINISWQRPESYVQDDGISWETNDIKGYQIFVRNSLLEPYRLVRYFKFNNTFPRSAAIYSKELISDDFIVSSEFEFSDSTSPASVPKFFEFTEFTMDIRPNTNYFFTLCSIDAHGNSSNYSAQYKIRRDNVTGEVDIQLACPEGAPKQYPNILIPGKLAHPSFKSSGYQYLDVHLAPDSKMSVPNIDEPAVNLQLFELETQIEKNIVITIKKNQ